jgi:hypothetical protein
MTNYIHDIPGRLRIRSPLVKHNGCAEREITDLLGSVPGIESVVVNTGTGSFLIRYDLLRASRRDIMAMLTEHGYFNPREAVSNDDYVASGAAKFFTLFLALFYPLIVEG